MDLGNTLGVVNLVILIGLLVLGAGAWKGRREVTTEVVAELKANLEDRVTLALCDDRHGRSEDELGGVRRRIDGLDGRYAPQADLRAVEKTLGSRMDALERTMSENGKTLQAIDQRTARIEGALSRMNEGTKA